MTIVESKFYVCRYAADVDDGEVKGRFLNTFEWDDFMSPETIEMVAEANGDKNISDMCCYPDGSLFVQLIGEDEEIYLPYYDESAVIVGMDIPAPCPGECIGIYHLKEQHLEITKPDNDGNKLVWRGEKKAINITRHPTQLAHDAGDSAVSTSSFHASAESTSQTETAPTQRV